MPSRPRLPPDDDVALLRLLSRHGPEQPDPLTERLRAIPELLSAWGARLAAWLPLALDHRAPGREVQRQRALRRAVTLVLEHRLPLPPALASRLLLEAPDRELRQAMILHPSLATPEVTTHLRRLQHDDPDGFVVCARLLRGHPPARRHLADPEIEALLWATVPDDSRGWWLHSLPPSTALIRLAELLDHPDPDLRREGLKYAGATLAQISVTLDDPATPALDVPPAAWAVLLGSPIRPLRESAARLLSRTTPPRRGGPDPVR